MRNKLTESEITDIFGVGLKRCPMCAAKEAEDSADGWTGGVFLRQVVMPATWGGAWPEASVYRVICGNCYLQIQRATKEDAVEAWNRRVVPLEEMGEAERAELERMEDEWRAEDELFREA